MRKQVKQPMSPPFSIRRCERKDEPEILSIINESARAYHNVIPSDRYHEPYMLTDELRREMGQMTFFGYELDSRLLGVVGFQPVKDVTLVRHLYVRPQYQRHGIGRKLTEHVIGLAKTRRILVGTWEAATWAIEFYERCGFKLLPNKDKMLREYWKIPERQIGLSVVLCFEKLPRA
jgi:GNAT superfamily N-acetyltransferase